MPREVVYEGPDLQQLLQRVIDEHGPARIHPPERRRKGGVLGFFAREVYVITVDVDPADAVTSSGGGGGADVAPATAGGPARPPATALAGLHADRSASTYTASASMRDGRSVASGSDVARTPLSALVESTEDEAELGSTAPTAGGAAAGGADRTAAGGGNSRTNGNGNGAAATGDGTEHGSGDVAPLHAAPADPEKPFGEVLSEVASSLGEEPGTYRPDSGKLRRPRRAAAKEAAAPAADDGAAPAGPRAAAQEAVGPHEAASSGALVTPAAATAPDDAPTGALAVDEPPYAAPPDDGALPVQLPLIQMDEEEPPELGATIVDLLRAAGFPEHLLPRAPLAPEQSTVEAVFAGLPEPPPLPTEPGGLVAVVGSAGLVRPVANSVALTVGCPRDEVAVASTTASDRNTRSEYRARTAAQAAAMSPGWRRDRVGVVAVYAPPLGADQRWTRQVLRALRPSCVWGMADATTKPDDVRRWVAAIGSVDALVMTDMGATATPASILSLGIPIARLDDDPATPARWAAVVADLVTKH